MIKIWKCGFNVVMLLKWNHFDGNHHYILAVNSLSRKVEIVDIYLPLKKIPFQKHDYVKPTFSDFYHDQYKLLFMWQVWNFGFIAVILIQYINSSSVVDTAKFTAKSTKKWKIVDMSNQWRIDILKQHDCDEPKISNLLHK